jgi:alkylation response protein AidB-like acyl-CoA dehydrogenase
VDFTFTPEQDDAAALAAQILKDRTGVERLREVEASGDRFDPDLWRELSSAGLVSLALPEEYGGAGLGLTELTRVLVEVGRTVAPVPLASHGAASLLVAELGTDEQKAAHLAGAASGETLLTAAVDEDRAYAPASPTTTATQTDGGWALSGTKTAVLNGARAQLFLVTATTDSGTGVFLVQADSDGVSVEPQKLTGNTGAARITFDGVSLGGDVLVGPADGTAAHRLGQLLTVTACAEQLGVTEGALALTSTYAREREQFGRPIGTFQAVSNRLADGYIDTLGQQLTLWQAVWRLEEGLDADEALAIAKLWASDAGHRVAHTTVHVHGGVGIDLDGVAHRYFSAAKRFDFAHGGTTAQALAIGRGLAASSSG